MLGIWLYNAYSFAQVYVRSILSPGFCNLNLVIDYLLIICILNMTSCYAIKRFS